MLDRSKIGHSAPPITNDVEKGAIRKFAEAIGDLNPLYVNEEAAAKGPFGATVAPPTFAQPLLAEGNALVRKGLDYDPKKLLHGEQQYQFFKPIKAGDRITCQSRIADIYEKGGSSGAMDFFVVETTGVDQVGEKVFVARSVLVVRR